MKKVLFKWGAVCLLALLVTAGCSKQQPAAPSQNTASEYDKLSQAEKAQYDKIKNAITNNLPYEISFSEKANQKGTIKYDFNNDGKIDTLNYSTNVKPLENAFEYIDKCSIDLNGKTIEQTSESNQGLSAIGIVDADTKDNYIEFYIDDDYLRAGNPTLYRLTANGIEKVCTMYGGILGTSGSGKLYYCGGNLFESDENGKFNTDLVLSYFDINVKDYVNTNQIVGKTITANQDILVYKSNQYIPNGAPQTQEEIAKNAKGKTVCTVKKGEKFQITNVDNGTKIKTDDGKTGWIGGFHMIWD